MKLIKLLIACIFLLGIFSCSEKTKTLTIKFKEIDELNQSSGLWMEETQIGEIIEITPQGGTIDVVVNVREAFADTIKVGADFFIYKSDGISRLMFRNTNNNAMTIPDGTAIMGKNSTWVWWNIIKEQIKDAADKGKDEFDKLMPKIKEKAKELYDNAPEMAEDVIDYADSLSKKIIQKVNE